MKSPTEITFLCLARNCAQHLSRFLSFFDEISAQSPGAVVVFGENGSTDSTKEVLQAASSIRSNVFIVDTTFMEQISGRLPRMAAGREHLANYGRRTFPSTRYFCIMDVDNVISSPPDVDSFFGALKRLDQDRSLSGISASSIPYYYDLLALRCPGFFERNIQPDIDANKRNPFRYYLLFRRKIYPVQVAFTQSVKRPCTSAYNGLCIYRAEDFNVGTYLDSSHDKVCEHVTFNHTIHAATGRYIAVDDSLVMAMPPEHGPQGFLTFILSRTCKAVRAR